MCDSVSDMGGIDRGYGSKDGLGIGNHSSHGGAAIGLCPWVRSRLSWL